VEELEINAPLLGKPYFRNHKRSTDTCKYAQWATGMLCRRPPRIWLTPRQRASCAVGQTQTPRRRTPATTRWVFQSHYKSNSQR